MAAKAKFLTTWNNMVPYWNRLRKIHLDEPEKIKRLEEMQEEIYNWHRTPEEIEWAKLDVQERVKKIQELERSSEWHKMRIWYNFWEKAEEERKPRCWELFLEGWEAATEGERVEFAALHGMEYTTP
jgi:hypothetical protein